MDVRHLRAWLDRAATACAAAWRALMPGRRPTVRQPVATRMVEGGAPHPRSDLASSLWMDDARRLHGRDPFAHLGNIPPGMKPPASAGPAPREARTLRPARSPRDEQLREILRDPRWASFDGLRGSPPPRLPGRADSRPAHRPGEGVISRPLTSPSPSGDAQPGPLTERERRRLHFLRELVERGVFNEGFAPERMPDQYRPKPPRADGRA